MLFGALGALLVTVRFMFLMTLFHVVLELFELFLDICHNRLLSTNECYVFIRPRFTARPGLFAL